MNIKEFEKRINFNITMLGHYHSSSAKTAKGLEKEVEALRIKTHCHLEQIERYGFEKWRSQFVRLALCVGNGFERYCRTNVLAAEKARNDNYQLCLGRMQAPLRQFQGLFTENEEFILTREQRSFRKEDIFGVLVCPDKIPDKLLVDLHLCDFSDCKNNPLERLRRKADPEVIDALKLIFFNLFKEGDVSFRREYILPKIETANVELRKKLLDYNTLCAGKILVISDSHSQRAFSIDEEPKSGVIYPRKKILIFSDAESRLRSGIYVKDSYVGEFKQLSDSIGMIYEISSLSERWKKTSHPKVKEIVQQQIEDTFKALHDLLEHAYNGHKEKADQFVANFLAREDLKKNKQAAMLIFSGVARSLVARLEEAKSKNKIKSYDTEDVYYEATLARKILGNIAINLNNALGNDSRNNYWEQELYFSALETDVAELRRVKIAPYSFFARALKEHFDRYKYYSVTKGKEEYVAESKQRLFDLMNLYRINRNFQGLLNPNLSRKKQDFYFDEVVGLLNELLEKSSKSRERTSLCNNLLAGCAYTREQMAISEERLEKHKGTLSEENFAEYQKKERNRFRQLIKMLNENLVRYVAKYGTEIM